MKNILIHIGYHKTGTTWLQQELFNSKNDAFIPISENKKGHSTIAKKFIWNESGYLLNSFDNNQKKIKESWNKILKDKCCSDNKTFVMSHERLSGNPHSSGFDSSIIARRINKIFPNSKILIIIREQSSWIFSNYFQYLSIGGTHSLKKYLNLKYDGKRPGFSPYHIEYHYLIKDYQNRFGEKNVLALPYEMLKSDKDTFLKRLSEFTRQDIHLSQTANDNMYNVKTNHYVNYKLRWLNLFIKASSVNNYSSLKNKFSLKVTFGLKKFLSRFISEKRNKSIENKLFIEIEEWSNYRFNDSNKITQDLIDVDLENFGYKTATNN